MAVLGVCEKLSKGCSVNEAKEALATIDVQLADEEKKDGHRYLYIMMALLSINKGKPDAADAALEALLRDGKGLSQIAVKSGKRPRTSSCMLLTGDRQRGRPAQGGRGARHRRRLERMRR